MKREGSLDELTDGKLYRSSDMARLGCQDCEGCSACCRNMGNTVVLDPYDIWRLEKGTGKTFAGMIGGEILLSVIDGLVLPSLNMERDGVCPFLNEAGRCRIHAYRPGICRLFPLGRYYHDGGFSYVLMKDACKKEHRTKVKIEQWLSEENLPRYESFVMQWKELQERTRESLSNVVSTGNEEEALAKQKRRSLSFLETFYLTAYGDDFFEDFSRREKNF